jgi:hypothetical protein
MAVNYKVLGQQNPAANTLTTLYTVPSSTQTIVSTVTVCNTSNTYGAFSLAVRVAGASIANTQYINYNTPVPGNDTITITLGITLGNTDVLSCNANTSFISFGAFGSEIS